MVLGTSIRVLSLRLFFTAAAVNSQLSNKLKKLSSYPAFLGSLSMFLMLADLTVVFLSANTRKCIRPSAYQCFIMCSQKKKTERENNRANTQVLTGRFEAQSRYTASIAEARLSVD